MSLSSRPGRILSFYRHFSVIVIVAAALGVASCGGGGGNSTPSPPPPDFSLSVTPSTLSLQQEGNGAQLTISVVPVNGFSGSVSVTFPNLPAGLSVAAQGFSSGPPFVASASTPLTIGVSATTAAAVGNTTITMQGTSGSLTHSATLNATIAAAVAFQLNVSPSTVTIGPNSQASTQVTLVPGANFGSNSVFLSFSSGHVGSTGVDMSLSSQYLTAAQPQATVSFQSGFQVATGSFAVPLTGTLGAQVVNLPLSLKVTDPAPACTSPSRSTVRRTDMDTTGVVYDPLHKLVFAAVQQTNTLQVFSSTTAQTVASIPIPEPWQLDITPDSSRILVGTFTNYMYWVDPVSLQIVGKIRVPAPLESGNLGIFAPQLWPVTLASGKVLVSRGGYPPEEWDPVTDAWSDPTPSGFASPNTLIQRSTDHSKVVLANANGLAIFDSATDSYGPVQKILANAVAINSNGSRLAVLAPSPSIPGGLQVALYDQNFNVLATYQFNSNSDGIPALDGVIFSWDNSTLFVLEESTVTALSATDLSFLGQVASAGAKGAGYRSDIDETNMIFSPGEGKAARAASFTDASSPCALGVDLPLNIAVAPPQGTLNAPSPVTVSAVSGITSQSQVYFGAAPGSPQATPGTNLAPNPPTSIQVTPPAANAAGAVNVTVTNPDGSMAIAPDGFSYGSSVLAVSTDSGPATGGTSVTLFGYGLAFDPSAIQVTVGGKAATVTNAFAGAGISPFPFPMDQVNFTSPAGSPGAADIVITTPVGAATVAKGFYYLQSVQSYAISSTLTEIAYDRSRQRLYATDGGSNVVDVFDLSKQQFLTPITVGNAPVALAITPDSSTLVVSNSADASVSIIDLTGLNPTRTVSIATLSNLPPQCGQPVPYAVATTSSNLAVIALTCPNVTEGELFVLDLATQAFGCGSSQGCAAMIAAFPENLSEGLTVTGTADGSAILVSNGPSFGIWKVTDDTFVSQISGGTVLPPLPSVINAAAADGSAFALGYGILEPTLDLYSMMQDPDYLRSGLNDINALAGEKLHPSGALLYRAESNGFSIYDVQRAHLKRRVALPQQVASTFDALALDETGSRVFMITTTGIAVVSVADLPLSLGNIQPTQGTAAGGTTVTLRGSGFQSGAQVFFGTTSVSAQFVDNSTLQVTSPAVSAGAVRITVVNPDGSQYSLDDGFTAE